VLAGRAICASQAGQSGADMMLYLLEID
jgi:hypothetical protein